MPEKLSAVSWHALFCGRWRRHRRRQSVPDRPRADHPRQRPRTGNAVCRQGRTPALASHRRRFSAAPGSKQAAVHKEDAATKRSARSTATALSGQARCPASASCAAGSSTADARRISQPRWRQAALRPAAAVWAPGPRRSRKSGSHSAGGRCASPGIAPARCRASRSRSRR